jgi:hypothetical protein
LGITLSLFFLRLITRSHQPENIMRASLLISAQAMNPGALTKFRKDGGVLKLRFDLAKLARNPSELTRATLNFTIVAVGVEDAAINASTDFKNLTEVLLLLEYEA